MIVQYVQYSLFFQLCFDLHRVLREISGSLMSHLLILPASWCWAAYVQCDVMCVSQLFSAENSCLLLLEIGSMRVVRVSQNSAGPKTKTTT